MELSHASYRLGEKGTQLLTLHSHLLNRPVNATLTGNARFAVEFLYFGIKEARACLFVGLFFAAIFTIPRAGASGISRYDILLIVALAFRTHSR